MAPARKQHAVRVAVASLVLLCAPLGRAHEVQPPSPILQPPAEWPGPASAHDVVVPVILTVAKDGSVEHVDVEVSVSRALDAAAIRAARRWVFEPARAEEGPVAAKVRAVVRFEGVVPVAAPPAEPAPKSDDVQVVGHGEEDHQAEVLAEGRARARTASGATVDRRALEAAPHRSGSDLLSTVPGVFITQHSGEGKAHQIFFRGFDAVHGQDLEVWAGGVPVNDVSHIHGQGYADLHFVIPEVVDRIDVLPGAYDPSQGDFAVAGSLRYHLGYREPGITARGSYGTFGTRRLFLGYHPDGEPHETFAAFEAYASDGFGSARASDRTSGMGQLVIDLGERARLRLLGSAYAGKFDSPGVLLERDVVYGRVDRFGSYDPDQGGQSTRAQFASELRYAGDSWRLSLMPWLVRRTLELRFDFTGALADEVNGDNTTQINDATTIGVTGSFDKDIHLFSEHDRIGAGLFVRHDMIDQLQRSTGGALPPMVDAEVIATDVAGWLELALKPVSRLLVRGGVRVDGLAYRVDDALTATTRAAHGFQVGPKASVDVGIAEGLNGIASYGMGFRSPQARSLADDEDTPFTRVHGWELGVRYRYRDVLSASLAGFVTLLSDDLVFNEATSRNEAVPGTLRVGGALNSEITPAPWFFSAFSASLTRASLRESGPRLEEGDLLPYVPQLVVRSDTAITPVLAHFWQRALELTVGAGWGYLFNRPLPFGEFGSDVFLLDAQTSLRLKEVEIGVSSTNLLGVDWYDSEYIYPSTFGAGPTQLIPRRHVTAGAPRTVLGTLTLYL